MDLDDLLLDEHEAMSPSLTKVEENTSSQGETNQSHLMHLVKLAQPSRYEANDPSLYPKRHCSLHSFTFWPLY